MIFAIASPFQQIISYSNCTDLSFPGTRVVAGWLSCHRDSTLFISASFSIQTGPGSNIVIPVGALEPLLFAGASPGRETAGTHHSRTHARGQARPGSSRVSGYVCCMYVLELSGLPRPLSHAVGRSGHGRPVTHVTR